MNIISKQLDYNINILYHLFIFENQNIDCFVQSYNYNKNYILLNSPSYKDLLSLKCLNPIYDRDCANNLIISKGFIFDSNKSIKGYADLNDLKELELINKLCITLNNYTKSKIQNFYAINTNVNPIPLNDFYNIISNIINDIPNINNTLIKFQ